MRSCPSAPLSSPRAVPAAWLCRSLRNKPLPFCHETKKFSTVVENHRKNQRRVTEEMLCNALFLSLFPRLQKNFPVFKKIFKSVARKRATKGLWEPKGEGGVFYESLNLNSFNKGLTAFCRFAAQKESKKPELSLRFLRLSINPFIRFNGKEGCVRETQEGCPAPFK